jgi:Xaa-Pro aminopeptidase
MKTPETEIRARLDAFRAILRAQGLPGAMLVHATDVFYLSGTRQNAALWAPAEGEPVLLVRKSVARARDESPLRDVRPFPSSKELASALGAPKRAGFTFDVVPGAVERFWARALGAELVDVSAALRTQRSVKSAWELERMRATAALLASVYAEVPSFLRAGMREVDLSAELEMRMRKAGNEGSPRLRGFNQEFFMGLAVAAGSSTAPSYFDGPVTGRGLSPSWPLGASLEPIPRDAPILLDYCAMKDGYVTDLTRIAVCGGVAPELARAFDVALRIQDEVARRLRPGETPSAIWARAKELAEEAGLGDRFMGPPGAQARFVGHGVGLELDELPVLAPGFDAPLVRGNVVAVEPKFVLPGLGAIGIENTFAVEDGGGARVTDLPDAILSA